MLTQYRPEIDGLRAIAVISVILFHLEIEAFSGGFLGVDIFFVISGFLITGMIKKELDSTGGFGFRNFYARRFWRLFPALVVMLAISSVVAVGMFSHQDLNRFGASLATSLTSTSNILFWAESDYFDASSRVKPLLHTWSLSVEEQFYIAWPLLLVLLSRYNLFFPLLLVPIALLSFFSNLEYSSWFAGRLLDILPKTLSSWLSEKEASTFFLLPFRAYEFCIGALLVYVGNRREKFFYVNEALSVIGLCLVLYTIFFFDENIPSYFYGLISCLGAALIIFSGKTKLAGWFLTRPLMIWIGVISYSLYLVHWPLVVFWEYISFKSITGFSLIYYFASCFLIGYALHKFVEKPFRHYRQTLNGSNRYSRVAMLTILSVFLMASGFSMWISNGWVWRISIPEHFLEVAGKDLNLKEYYGGGVTMKERPSYNGGASPDNLGVIFIGDSYSRAYHSGLADLYPDHPFTFFEYSGCEFYSLTYYGKSASEGRNERCSKERELAFEMIRKSNHPDVVISQHWYASFIEDQKSSHTNEVLNRDSLFSNARQYSQFVFDELTNLKKELNIGRLTIIGGPPKVGLGGRQWLSIGRCMFLPWGLNDLECQTTSRDNNVVSFHDEFNASLGHIVNNSSKDIDFIDPFSALCSEESCRNFDKEGMPIYSDYGHLSIWGNEFVMKDLSTEFDAIFSNQ